MAMLFDDPTTDLAAFRRRYETTPRGVLRHGQALFTLLYAMRPALADKLRGHPTADPFYLAGVGRLGKAQCPGHSVRG